MIKIIFRFSVLLFCLSMVNLVSADAGQQQSGLQTVVLRRLKLRAGPGVQWAILGYIEAGETVLLDGRAPYEDTLWVRGITAQGRVGWMAASALVAPPEEIKGLPTVTVDTPFSLTPPSLTSSVSPIATVFVPIHGVVSGITSNIRKIFRTGQKLGNRANVFSKVGDSITTSPAFLIAVGQGRYNLHNYSSLQGVIDYFSVASVRDNHNSFENSSLAAHGGWTTAMVLNPDEAWKQICEAGETPLACEYRVSKPAVALIMLGTNDLSNLPSETYRANLTTIVQMSIDRGIIPVLSTIPFRQGYEESVAVYNQIVVDTARKYDIPLWDFHSVLESLPDHGLADGVHPTGPPPDQYPLTADFTPDNLRYGYTLRTLSALQVLDAVWRKALR